VAGLKKYLKTSYDRFAKKYLKKTSCGKLRGVRKSTEKKSGKKILAATSKNGSFPLLRRLPENSSPSFLTAMLELGAGLPDRPWCNVPKWGKNTSKIQQNICTKLP
jgi:hypothetical protein